MSQQKTALERIEELEKRCQQIEANTGGTYALAENCLQKLMALEQSYAALAKTLHAVITSLKEDGNLSDEKVMGNIRKLDDEQDRIRIQEMTEAGTIKSIDTVHENSLAVVKNVVIPKDNPNPVTLSEYRVIEMPSPTLAPKIRQELTGKKVGDTVKMSTKEFDALYVVLEAYELAEANKMADNETTEQEKANEQSLQTEQAGEAQA